MIENITLSNGVGMPMQGFGVFQIPEEDTEKIRRMDTGTPSMLDCSKPSEVDRLYDYLKNPVLTTILEHN